MSRLLAPGHYSLLADTTNARAGIICLTPSNLKEPWILFEAGAIAKTVRQKPLTCTLLIGLEIATVSGPLAQFQATKLNESDMLAMIKSLNKALGDAAVDERQIENTFELCWPRLKETLNHLPEDGPEKQSARRPEDMLEEFVALMRRTTLSVLESNRQTMEQVTLLQALHQSTLAAQSLWSPLGTGKMVNLSALLDSPVVPSAPVVTNPSQPGTPSQQQPHPASLRKRRLI